MAGITPGSVYFLDDKVVQVVESTIGSSTTTCLNLASGMKEEIETLKIHTRGTPSSSPISDIRRLICMLTPYPIDFIKKYSGFFRHITSIRFYLSGFLSKKDKNNINTFDGFTRIYENLPEYHWIVAIQFKKLKKIEQTEEETEYIVIGNQGCVGKGVSPAAALVAAMETGNVLEHISELKE